MSAGTLIQWCHATINFWWGCTKVSCGCANCYAEKMAKRLGRGRASWGTGGLRWLRVGEACLSLLQLNRRAEKKKVRLRVFINSMSDTFEDRRDLDAARTVLFAIGPCVPHLDLLLLTKRPENVEKLVPQKWSYSSHPLYRWPDNMWLGFSGENQEMFDARWPVVQHLARQYGVPCIFCSAEPLVGPLDVWTAEYWGGGEDEPETRGLDWLILGGESGQQARPCDLVEMRKTIVQAHELEIAVFVKQLGRRPVDVITNRANREIIRLKLKDGHGGNMAEWPEDLRVRELPQPSFVNGVKP